MPARRLRPLIVLLVGLTVVGGLLQPVTTLRAVTSEGAALACRRLAPGDTVTLIFTHSMYGGEVREIWRVAGDGLARESIVTERAAAAEYYATDGAVERGNGGFVVVSPPLVIEALPVRVDGVGRHRLRFGHGDEVSLADRIEGSAAVTIGIRHHTLLQHRIGGCDG